MEPGKIKGFVDGYMFFEIAGKITITRYQRLNAMEIRVLQFHSVDQTFEYEDATVEDSNELSFDHISAVILSSKVLKTSTGFKTHVELNVL